MLKERITVILGAGAMIEASGVSTRTITEKIIDKCKKYKINDKNDKSVVDIICNKFLLVYENNVKEFDSKLSELDKITNLITFEDIYHVLELISSYSAKSGYKGHASGFQVFSDITNEFKDLDIGSVYLSIREIIDIINEEVYSYDCKFKELGNDFKKFFEELKGDKYALDIFNLNYDTWIEQSLETYNDGYIDIEGYGKYMQRFDINEYLMKDDRDTISHLHGQICFEYPSFKSEDINKYVFKESHNTLYKYTNFQDSKEIRDRTWRSADLNQAGETLFRSNVVTGLMKTDKLLWSPLNVYHSKLMNCLIENKKLVIVGYGFFDLYINNFLYQYNAAHFEDKKVLLIDYISDTDWNPLIEHPFKPNDKALFTNLIYEDDLWCRDPFKKIAKFEVSENQKIAISIKGFKNTYLENMENIKEFLEK